MRPGPMDDCECVPAPENDLTAAGGIPEHSDNLAIAVDPGGGRAGGARHVYPRECVPVLKKAVGAGGIRETSDNLAGVVDAESVGLEGAARHIDARRRARIQQKTVRRRAIATIVVAVAVVVHGTHDLAERVDPERVSLVATRIDGQESENRRRVRSVRNSECQNYYSEW